MKKYQQQQQNEETEPPSNGEKVHFELTDELQQRVAYNSAKGESERNSKADPLPSTSSAGTQENSDDEYAWAKFISDDEDDDDDENEDDEDEIEDER